MYTTIIAALAALAVAAPVEKRQEINDGVILNYALTLEHLENAFYKEGLAKFSREDFAKAGANPNFYDNLKTISSDEETHVTFLTTALKAAGVQPVEASTYNFGATDAATFLVIANVLEGVGVSAYLGAAQFIANKAYLTAAGSILTVEARHSAYLRDNQTPDQSPFPSPFDTPLGINQVFTLAAPFIVSSPASNPALPVKAFPSITVTAGSLPKAGDQITLTTAQEVSATKAYFYSITGPVEAQVSGSGSQYTVTIPEGAPKGQSYVVLTSGGDAPSDDNIVAGPGLFQIADDAAGRQTETPAPAPGAPGYGDYGNYGTYGTYGHY